MIYPVADIFHSLQGEGHFAGTPMTFVRLAGCSVTECSIRSQCDEAPWKMKVKLRTCDIVDRVFSANNCSKSGIVCITGGEPTDHDLTELVTALRDAGYRVHIETSGVRSIEGIPFDWITVSPKTFPYAQQQGHTLKIVVRPEWGNDPTRVWEYIAGASDDTNFFHRYLQPLYGADGKPVNLDFVVQLLLGPHRNSGAKWSLSMQGHKAWGVK